MNNKVTYTVTANDILSGKLQEMDRNARGLEGTMGNLASKIGMAFGAYQVAGFVKSVISAGTTVEDAMTGLTTLLGNSAEANRVVQNTMADASATPFAFEGLLSANKALIGAGVSADGARTDVLNLANAIASTGGGDDELQRMVVNMQQIRNVGKASALDIKQFAFAGVNVYKALADATGKPIESIKGMEVSYDLLSMALQKAHDKGGIYYNGLENMSKNTSVRISAIGDAVFQTMNDLFQDFKPMIDGVLESTMSLIDGVKELLGWFREHRAVTTALGEAIKVTAGAILLFVTYQKSMAIWTALTTTSIFAQTFSAGMLMAGFNGASGAGMVLAGVMAVLNAVNPVYWIIAGIAVLTAGVIYLYERFEQFRGAVWGTWEVIKTFTSIAGSAFKALGAIIYSAFNMDPAGVIKAGMELVKIAGTAGGKLAESAKKGYTDGINDKIKEDKESKAQGGLAGVSKLNPMTGAGSGASPEAKSKASGVSGAKVVTINVTIGSLINDFQIKTTNIQESTNAIKEKVIMALTSAVNDSQIIAGQ